MECRVEDLEVRFSVDTATDLTLCGYCIVPVRDEVVAGNWTVC